MSLESDLVPVRKLKVSVVQACTVRRSLASTLDKLEKFARIAKERDGSQFVVFPEAFIGSYPKGHNFGAVIGDRSAAGREEYLEYHSAAIEITSSSPAIVRMEAISKQTGLFLVVGVIERDSIGEQGGGGGGTLYCTVVFVDPEKGYVGKRRKLVPTAAERVVWGQGDGSTLKVVEKEFGPREMTSFTGGNASIVSIPPVKTKLSAAICWENYMPLLRYHYYSQGTELYCAPTVDARPEWQHTMTHIALEGRCFVLSACQFGRYPDFVPPRIETEVDDREIIIGGGSVIINPLGKVLAGPLRDEEDVLSAEIDLNDCVRGKFDLDVVGHYARPDVFSLHVNTSQ